MKIAITGALGHIGSFLIRQLPDYIPDLDLILLDNLSTQRYSSLFNLPSNAKYKFYDVDVVETNIESLIRDAEIVIHLAAITNATESFSNHTEVEHINYNATVRVAEACSKTGSSLIHISSTSVYGTQNEVVDEDCSKEELNPQSPYAATKLKEEDFLQNFAEKGNLNFITCRFGTICGISPGMRFHTAVNKFCWQAVLGQPVTVWRTALDQKRPYLTLEEASRAIWFIIENKLFDRRVYNILSDNLTVQSVIDFIKVHVPLLSVSYVDEKVMNQLSYEVLNKRFSSKGFIFKGDIPASIADTIRLLNSNLS